jgi:thiamine transport system permease protein
MLVSGALLVTAVGLLAPLAALAVRSFTLGDQGFTLIYYQALTENPRQSAFFAPPITAIANSLLYALATLAISLPLGVISAYMLARPTHAPRSCSTRCCCCRSAPRR